MGPVTYCFVELQHTQKLFLFVKMAEKHGGVPIRHFVNEEVSDQTILKCRLSLH